MPYFDEASLRRLAEGFGAVPDKAQRLMEALLAREYVSESAKEYAHHGVGWRLSILARCIEQIYRRLPPERDEVPPREALLDTTIGIQAFVFNAVRPTPLKPAPCQPPRAATMLHYETRCNTLFHSDAEQGAINADHKTPGTGQSDRCRI
jgi:hypothetical protein